MGCGTWNPFDLLPQLSEVRVPTLVIHGRKDRVIPCETGRLLHGGIGHARLLLCDEGDHALAVKSPELVAPSLLRFL